jgi:hypothetical protein
MDGDCSYEDFRDCLRSLETVNRWLLGYRPTLAWLERLPRGPRDPVHIVDVGSGGGDLLRQIAGWARRRGIAVQLTGIDLNPHAARAAAESTPKELGITWVTGDAMVYQPEKPIDIVVSSLMTHHLEDEEIVALLCWMEATVQVGWFINDLERSEWSSRMFGWVRWHWLGVVPAGLPEGGLGEPAGCGRGSARGDDGGALAAGTAVRGAVEVRPVILKRLVRLRDMKPVVPVVLMAHLITSNHLRGESCQFPLC